MPRPIIIGMAKKFASVNGIFSKPIMPTVQPSPASKLRNAMAVSLTLRKSKYSSANTNALAINPCHTKLARISCTLSNTVIGAPVTDGSTVRMAATNGAMAPGSQMSSCGCNRMAKRLLALLNESRTAGGSESRSERPAPICSCCAANAASAMDSSARVFEVISLVSSAFRNARKDSARLRIMATSLAGAPAVLAPLASDSTRSPARWASSSNFDVVLASVDNAVCAPALALVLVASLVFALTAALAPAITARI